MTKKSDNDTLGTIICPACEGRGRIYAREGLRALREHYNLTGAAVAREMGVTKQYVYQLENVIALPNAEQRVAYKRAVRKLSEEAANA